MNVIYEPKGRAKEYAPLACNLYMGCTHGCTYCYAPGCMHKTSQSWHGEAVPRKDVLSLFEKDAKKLSGDTRRVLFCFLSDPYQPLERTERLTQQGIRIAHKHNVKIDILTKGDTDLIAGDLPLMKLADVHLGITLSFINDKSREEWEQKGWIHEQDPRGWFQWYCRYYLGRRTADDARQMKRWKQIRRHVSQIQKYCVAGDELCRPRQRQAVLHWAYDSRKL